MSDDNQTYDESSQHVQDATRYAAVQAQLIERIEAANSDSQPMIDDERRRLIIKAGRMRGKTQTMYRIMQRYFDERQKLIDNHATTSGDDTIDAEIDALEHEYHSDLKHRDTGLSRQSIDRSTKLHYQRR